MSIWLFHTPVPLFVNLSTTHSLSPSFYVSLFPPSLSLSLSHSLSLFHFPFSILSLIFVILIIMVVKFFFYCRRSAGAAGRGERRARGYLRLARLPHWCPAPHGSTGRTSILVPKNCSLSGSAYVGPSGLHPIYIANYIL